MEDNIDNKKDNNKDNNKKKMMIKIILIIIAIIIYTIIVVRLSFNYYSTQLNNAFKNITFETESSETDDNSIIEGNQNNDISISSQGNNKASTSTTINFNDVVTKDSKYELTVLSYNFAKKILPPNTSGFYTYYEAKEDGHQYLEIKLNYKNLDGTEITADDIGSIKVKYANKYEYTGFSTIEDSSGDFTYTNITSIAPLTTGKLHYLFDVPDEVVNSSESLVAYINIGNDNYELVLR